MLLLRLHSFDQAQEDLYAREREVSNGSLAGGLLAWLTDRRQLVLVSQFYSQLGVSGKAGGAITS